MSDLVRRDVKLSGFVANDIKSQWTPAQMGELLVKARQKIGRIRLLLII